MSSFGCLFYSILFPFIFPRHSGLLPLQIFRHLYRDLIQVPDIIHILLDGTVRGEFAHTGHLGHGQLRPAFLIPVSLLHALLSLCIGTEILQAEIRIRPLSVLRVQQGIVQLPETLGVIR